MGFRVRGLGFRVLGFRVWDLGCQTAGEKSDLNHLRKLEQASERLIWFVESNLVWFDRVL